jgi:mannosyltransferase
MVLLQMMKTVERANYRITVLIKTDFEKALRRSPWLEYGLLGAVLLLATALRFYKLGAWSFWIDEIYTLRDIELLFQTSRLPRPFFLMSSLPVSLWGASEWSARLVPALLGILSIPVFYFITRRLTGSAVALLSVFFLAVSPWHLYWSQNARFYTLLLLVYTVGLFLFYLALERDNGRFAAIGAVLLTIAVIERMSSFIFVPVILLYIGLLRVLRMPRPAGLNLRVLGWLLVPVMVIVLIEGFAYFFGMRVESLEQVVEDRAQVRSTFEVILTLFIGNPGASPQWFVNSIVESIGIPVFFLALFSGLSLVWQRDRFGLFLSMGALVPVLLIVAASFFVYVVDRYIFVALFFWILLAAIGLYRLTALSSSLETRLLGLGVLAVVMVTFLAQNVYYFKYENGARTDWRGALAFVEQHRANSQEPLFIAYPIIADYYLPDSENVFHIDEIVSYSQQHDADRIWLLDSGWLSLEAEQWLVQNARLMTVLDVHTTIEQFGMRVFLYDTSPPSDPSP